ncbi:hypothetical protein BE20_58280 [Sorangium cellulosum]|uniref:Uncharacterized protein n=1 Tax=Sorangium cellulosum TaxID=56 RepID=A0A150SSB7_SORCE|nr:hypothetical protein BE18_12985 [Sorangium cellulosum]KYF99759.1 hypothetical protein BE20_58280 [Sorangium cellulosum]
MAGRRREERYQTAAQAAGQGDLDGALEGQPAGRGAHVRRRGGLAGRAFGDVEQRFDEARIAPVLDDVERDTRDAVQGRAMELREDRFLCVLSTQPGEGSQICRVAELIGAGEP